MGWATLFLIYVPMPIAVPVLTPIPMLISTPISLDTAFPSVFGARPVRMIFGVLRGALCEVHKVRRLCRLVFVMVVVVVWVHLDSSSGSRSMHLLEMSYNRTRADLERGTASLTPHPLCRSTGYPLI
eukprot:1393243-Amorphochlora_amoeboformis.AAC.1